MECGARAEPHGPSPCDCEQFVQLQAILEQDPTLATKLSALKTAYEQLQVAVDRRARLSEEYNIIKTTQAAWDDHLLELATDINSTELSFGITCADPNKTSF
jgi:hypothetical protein